MIEVRCKAIYINFRLLICWICSNEYFLKLNMEIKYPKCFKTVNVPITEEWDTFIMIVVTKRDTIFHWLNVTLLYLSCKVIHYSLYGNISSDIHNAVEWR